MSSDAWGLVSQAGAVLLRGQRELAGPVASDPVVSLLDRDLAADGPQALKATIVIAHLEKDQAAPCYSSTGPSRPGPRFPLTAVLLLTTRRQRRVARDRPALLYSG